MALSSSRINNALNPNEEVYYIPEKVQIFVKLPADEEIKLNPAISMNHLVYQNEPFLKLGKILKCCKIKYTFNYFNYYSNGTFTGKCF